MMKRIAGTLLFIVLAAAAFAIYWFRFHAPVEASVQGAALSGGYLQGSVANKGEQTISHSNVSVTFMDTGGATVGTGGMELGEIAPGQSLPLRVPAPPTATRFTISVQSRAGGL